MNPLIPEETSKRITSLRFILACLVVFIHNTLPPIQNQIESGELHFYTYFWVMKLFTKGFGLCAVPLFFTFAAYLQAKKADKYSILLKKRTKTILLPYIIWISIYLLWQIFGKLFIAKVIPSVLTNEFIPVQNWTVLDWIQKVIGYGYYLGISDDNFPGAAGQLWFLRDLMILVILSPLFMKLIKYTPSLLISIIFIFLLLGIKLFFVISNSTLLFYLIGLYWGYYDLPILEKIDRIHWYEIIPAFVFALIGNYALFKNNISSYVLTIISATLLLKFSSLLIINEKVFDNLKKLSGYSFFLYCIHEPVLLPVFITLWMRYLPITNSFFCIMEYFIVTIITIIIGTTLGILIKKFIPKLFSILNGGR